MLLSQRQGGAEIPRRDSWVGALALALSLSILPCVVAALVAGWAWRDLHRPYGPSAEVVIDIPAGLDANGILRLLSRSGLVPRAGLARLYLIYVLEDPPLLAGEYLFDGPLSTPEVLAKIARGAVATHPVTIIEGLTLEETAEAISAAGFGRRELLVELMSDPSAIRDLDPEATDLEGYLFPDTYAFARGTSEGKIVSTLVRTFRRQLEGLGEGRSRQAASVRELTTLASIVEKEARLDGERPLIAGVYAHRLSKGIALYADPTIIFALKKAGTWDGNLRRPDLALASPYNTYVHRGLPPGPICSPGLKSLVAAAAPQDTTHLYFVSRNDGSHIFADTLAEHNRNVERWQKQYWRERWARERGD